MFLLFCCRCLFGLHIVIYDGLLDSDINELYEPARMLLFTLPDLDIPISALSFSIAYLMFLIEYCIKNFINSTSLRTCLTHYIYCYRPLS